MHGIIEKILARLPFEKIDVFKQLLYKCIVIVKDPDEKYELDYIEIGFKIQDFFKGFSPFINHYGKDKKYKAGAEALGVIYDELGIELEPTQCFILFHLRELGKFRAKDSKLILELRPLWGQYKEFKMDDGEYAYALKDMMRKNVINFRRGNITLNPQITNRYTDDGLD